jgi:ferritin
MLNKQVRGDEFYLQMSAWCSDKGFEGAASFLKMHSREEMEHMQRLFDYLSDTGAMPVPEKNSRFSWSFRRPVISAVSMAESL